MALQKSSYNHLPMEIKLHILSNFLDLETLVDIIRYIDKTHHLLVIDILKKYTLTQTDCDSYWFEFIKKQNTLFLHKYLNPQNKDTMIRSSTTNINSLPWINYLREVVHISIEKNNYLLYGSILGKYFNYNNIRQYITSNSPKWYLSTVTTSFVETINFAITYNAISNIRLILEYPVINFRFNKDDLEEQTFSNDMFYNFAKTAILHNKVGILSYFVSRYNKFTNEQLNDLLVLCASNTLIDTAIHENKPHVLDYIISKLTNSNASDASNASTYHLLDTHITKFYEELFKKHESIPIVNENIIIYFLNKFSKKLTIEQFKDTISCRFIYNNIDKFKQVYTLYLESYSVFPDCPLFTPDELLIHDNLMIVILTIKKSFIYKCFLECMCYGIVDTMIFLQDILFTNCIKYNLTKELFVKYICLDYIQYSIELNHNEIETKKMYSILLKDLPSIYDIGNIKSIMDMISVKYSAIECYTYFHNLFIQKSVLSRQIYIKLLKDNLYVSIQNTCYSTSLNKVLAFILLKLKEFGEVNVCQNDQYIPLFINFIKTKNDSIIELMCNNGFNVSGNNEYLQLALKTRYVTLIKVLINCGAYIESHEYAVLHYALKQKTTKLSLFIKGKLVANNKLQEYLDWETNQDYKTKFLSF